MKTESDQPLTPEEAEKMVEILWTIADQCDRLIHQGCQLTENDFNDERIEQVQRTIENLGSQMQKKKQLLRRLKAHLEHRRSLLRKSRS